MLDIENSAQFATIGTENWNSRSTRQIAGDGELLDFTIFHEILRARAF